MFLNYWILGILFVIGLSIGSFINVLEIRTYKKIDFIKERSFCPICKHTLNPIDLVPILSFILIKGRCRYCGTKVSWQYPIVEFLAGILFFTSGLHVLGKMHIYCISDILISLITSIFIGLIMSLFLFFALYDVKHKIVLNKVIYPSLIFVLLFDVILTTITYFYPNWSFLSIWGEFSILWNFLSGTIGGLFILLIIILTKGKGMGGGDLKLVVLMGFLIGFKRLIIAFYISALSGSLLGIIWGLYKGKILGLKIPFGLFLSAGTIISFFYSSKIEEIFFKICSLNFYV